MAAIQGLKDVIKSDVAEYCKRHNMSQVEWVEKHIKADIRDEQNPPEETKGE